MSTIRQFVGALDQGTTSSRFIIYDTSTFNIVVEHQDELPFSTPRDGWVEHDALRLYDSCVTCMNEAIHKLSAKYPDSDVSITALGIVNQRETTIVWDVESGRPLQPAIVWSDARTADTVAAVAAELAVATRGKDGSNTDASPDDASLARAIAAPVSVTGLPLSTYFSALKLRWMIDADPHVADALADGTAIAGTVDSYLIWRLTRPGAAVGGASTPTSVKEGMRSPMGPPLPAP
eukprot:TRINITY_DN46322_c0_g1_i1.p1 TRINITY_DN46322_c0_g1~~TRINITY_DN46322_c0_g1_i1.p1  ORF type:complete len:235 (-),score=40.63 TRINITY_DN46322_c0_g1_i1:102-806(-)